MNPLSKYATLAAGAMLVVSLVTAPADAQEPRRPPRVSPKASVSQTIGYTDVTITYSRPGVKERVIWGGLVPYGEIWRVGANEATTIEFGADVKVEGHDLAAGKYSLWAIPGERDWTFIFNSNPDMWGTQYDVSTDVLKVSATPSTGHPHIEWMMYSFQEIEPEAGKASLVLSWEKLRVGFTIQTEMPGGNL